MLRRSSHHSHHAIPELLGHARRRVVVPACGAQRSAQRVQNARVSAGSAQVVCTCTGHTQRANPAAPSPRPFPFPAPPSLLPPLSVYVTHYLSFYSPLSVSLQVDGSTALILASQMGRTEAMKLLLAAPGINVNHARVSLYLLTPSP